MVDPDYMVESDESFTATISGITPTTIGDISIDDDTATVTIENDDSTDR